MSEKKISSINELNEVALDELLQAEASELPPPDQIVDQVTPWSRAIKRIFIGMALNAIVTPYILPFVNHIMPTVGIFLMVLGFRSLREENNYFKSCWKIILIQMCGVRFPSLILGATMWQNTFYTSTFPLFFSLINLAFTIALMLNLQNGFHVVRQKAGLTERSGVINLMVIWYIILCAFELAQYGTFYASLPMLIIYVFLYRKLSILIEELDQVGYVIHPAAVKLSERKLVGLLAAILLLGIASGYLFFNKYPMDWQEIDTSEHAKQEDIKLQLLELGFPEEILNDLTAEDIKACKGATNVYLLQHDMSFSFDDETPDLLMTNVIVQLPDTTFGELTEWKFFHHFTWLETPTFCGTEILEIIPAYYTNDFVWELDHNEAWEHEISGRVLYSEDGQTYASEFYKLGHIEYWDALEDSYSAEPPRTLQTLTGTFSFPSGHDNYRGYISYEMYQRINIKSIITSDMNYVHQKSQLWYPVVPAELGLLSGYPVFDNIYHGMNFTYWAEDGDVFS